MIKPGPGTEEITALHARMNAQREAEREVLLNDARLQITRITLDWPWNMRRTWLDLFGVVGTYVCNAVVWGGITVTVWREFPEGVARGLATVWPIVATLSNVRLLAEELWRQWEVTK